MSTYLLLVAFVTGCCTAAFLPAFIMLRRQRAKHFREATQYYIIRVVSKEMKWFDTNTYSQRASYDVYSRRAHKHLDPIMGLWDGVYMSMVF